MPLPLPLGEPRVNADAALRLLSAHRRLDADYAWATLEAECSARAAGKEPGSGAWRRLRHTAR